MADTIVDLERKFYIQQLGLSAGQASVQDLDAHVDAAAAVALPSVNDYKPAIDLTENFPRSYVGATNVGAFTTGRIYLQAIYLTAGMSIASIVYQNGTVVAAGQTNFWASLWSPSLTKVAVSQDELTTIVGNSAERIFTLVGGPYPIATSGMYYAGLCFVGTTVPTGVSCLGSAVTNGMPPVLNCLATVTGLTNPASCPASVVLGAASNSTTYVQVR